MKYMRSFAAVSAVLFLLLLAAPHPARAAVLIGPTYNGGLASSLLFQQVRAIFDPLANAFVPEFSENRADVLLRVKERIERDINSCEKFRSDAEARYQCLHDAAGALLAQHTFPDIVAAAEMIHECHDYMHHLAQGAYYVYGSLAKVFESGSSACFSAVYHGAPQGYLVENSSGSLKEIERSIIAACTDSVDDVPKNYLQCVHGIGHALMLVTAGDLTHSLTLCDSFADPGERSNCYGGVFMEHVPGSQVSPYPNTREGKDPWAPCRALDERYQPTCYSFQLGTISGPPDARMKSMAFWCGKTPAAAQDACFTSFGSGVGGLLALPEEQKNTCMQLSEDSWRRACVRGVVAFYYDHSQGLEGELAPVLNFCAALPQTYHEVCYARAGGIFRNLPDEARARLCALTGEWEVACLNGA